MHPPDITNIYQLSAFLVVAALQLYTRWEVARLATKQDQMNAAHDASRAELLALVARTSGRLTNKTRVELEEVVEAIKGALKVSYLQGQADATAGRPYPEGRAAEAAKTLVDVIVKAARTGDAPTT